MGYANAAISASASITRNLEGNAMPETFGSGFLVLSKPISGAGDELTTSLVELLLVLGLEGTSDTFFAADSTMFLVKNAEGYEIAVATVVDAHLRRLFRYSGVQVVKKEDAVGFNQEVLASVSVEADIEEASSVATAALVAVGAVVERGIQVSAELELGSITAVDVQEIGIEVKRAA